MNDHTGGDEFEVPESLAGERLDRTLAMLTGWTRSEVQSLVEAGAVGGVVFTEGEALLDEAQRLTGLKERAALIREGLKALIERESARRLARLGGSEPRVQPPPRRAEHP